jgi:hypothetical protein
MSHCTETALLDEQIKLATEKHNLEKLFTPWRTRHEREIAFDPQCKTETMRTATIHDTSLYPSDMLDIWKRLQEIEFELSMVMLLREKEKIAKEYGA